MILQADVTRFGTRTPRRVAFAGFRGTVGFQDTRVEVGDPHAVDRRDDAVAVQRYSRVFHSPGFEGLAAAFENV